MAEGSATTQRSLHLSTFAEKKEAGMDFYTAQHKHYCGIDLHARSMYVCILDQQGVVLLHRNLPCDAQRFLLAIQPFREDLVVAVECIFTWY